MKNIYDITDGQLITIWIFGILGTISLLEITNDSVFTTFMSVLIPFLVIFYTLGVRNRHRELS